MVESLFHFVREANGQAVKIANGRNNDGDGAGVHGISISSLEKGSSPFPETPIHQVNSGAWSEANPAAEDERLPDYIDRSIRILTDLFKFILKLPNNFSYSYGYTRFRFPPLPAMVEKTAFSKARWCFLTPSKRIDEPNWSNDRPDFMVCQIITTWPEQLQIAHITVLLAFLLNNSQLIWDFFKDPQSHKLLHDLQQLLYKNEINPDFARLVANNWSILDSYARPQYSKLQLDLVKHHRGHNNGGGTQQNSHTKSTPSATRFL